MRIETKEQLRFCIAADRIMNGRDVDGNPVVNLLRRIAKPDPIMSYLKAMRKIQFYRGKNEAVRKFYQGRYNALGLKLGFSIDPMVFSEGLVIPHYGTIVVGGGNFIGSFAVLHTSTCITVGAKRIGKGFYLSTGSIVIKDVSIADHVTVSANSLVNRDVEDGNNLVAGSPAGSVRQCPAWYDAAPFDARVKRVEQLRAELDLHPE